MTLTLAEIGKGVTFGDTEMMTSGLKRNYSAICVSTKATVYTLPREVF
jgi:hypothetical protein